MTSKDVSKVLKDFVAYLQKLPIDKSPNKDKIQKIIDELKALSEKPINKVRIQQIKRLLGNLRTYAKHPTTLKNIQIMLDAIKSKKRPNVFLSDILTIVNSYMTYDEILKKCRTDREFLRACNSPFLWYMLMQRDFPHIKVSQSDKDLRQQYQKYVKEYKDIRQMIYNKIKMRLKWYRKPYAAVQTLTVILPVEAIPYLSTQKSRFNYLEDAGSIIERDYTPGTSDKVDFYVTLDLTLFDEYRNQDKKVLSYVNATLDFYKQVQATTDIYVQGTADMNKQISSTTHKLLEKEIPMYVITEKEEHISKIPFDILSAHAYNYGIRKQLPSMLLTEISVYGVVSKRFTDLVKAKLIK